MNACLIKTLEYQTKLKLSGIPESIFHAQCGVFLERYGRLPNLDELPNADSSKYLADTLHLTDVNSATLEDIQAITGASSIQEANIILNDKHSDLEVEIIPLGKEAIVDVTRRPSLYYNNDNELVTVDENPNMTVVFNQMINKLLKLYGILINSINNLDLLNFLDVPNVSTASAFIHNGNIYVNTSLALADAPIHEMTHLLLGSIRYKNPDLYFKLVESALLFGTYEHMKMFNLGRALSDILEETFVQQVGRYLAGMKSDIDALPDNIKYEINYGIKRLLDSVLMGDYSVKSLDSSELYKMTLPELAKELNSKLLEPSFYGSLDDAAQHRILANVKEDMIKNGQLLEICS